MNTTHYCATEMHLKLASGCCMTANLATTKGASVTSEYAGHPLGSKADHVLRVPNEELRVSAPTPSRTFCAAHQTLTFPPKNYVRLSSELHPLPLALRSGGEGSSKLSHAQINAKP